MNSYAYLIGWSSHGKFYYGAQWNKKANPGDLWVRYYTSSKWVKKFREKHGDPDIIEIRKTFGQDAGACREWEERVLNRLRKANSDKWLNRSTGNKKWFTRSGWSHSEETIEKISKSRKGMPGKLHTTEAKEKISKKKIGVRRAEFSPEHIKKLSDSGKNRLFTEEHRKKLSSAQSGMVNAISISTGKTSRVTKEEFHNDPDLVGRSSGIRHSEQTKSRISAGRRGVYVTTGAHGVQ